MLAAVRFIVHGKSSRDGHVAATTDAQGLARAQNSKLAGSIPEYKMFVQH